MTILSLLGIGLLAACALMFATWVIASLIKNAGFVDVIWGAGFVILSAVYAYVCRTNDLHGWLIIGMVSLANARLTVHLARRFMRMYPKEDARYRKMRAEMGDNANFKMLGVFLFQGIAMTILTAPLAVALLDEPATLGFNHFFALGIWAISLVGEAVADEQLARHTREEKGSKTACKIGLWKYSRHPNYFFEWMTSVSFFVFAVSSPYGFWTIISPLCLLYLLIFVTGVKPSEEQSLKSRSDYVDYQRRTSAFVPWFQKQ